MKKNKHYFLRIALLKTIVSGIIYLAMPIFAKIYVEYVGDLYYGYTIFASAIFILTNMILLVRAWTLAFDKDARKEYLSED